jgi:hypothetical protein
MINVIIGLAAAVGLVVIVLVGRRVYKRRYGAGPQVGFKLVTTRLASAEPSLP